MEVPEQLADKVRTISKSLKVHETHNQVSGHAHHFARQAAFAASSGDAELQGALQVHRAANRAKHRWADINESTVDPWPATSSLPPLRGTREHQLPHDDFYTDAGASSAAAARHAWAHGAVLPVAEPQTLVATCGLPNTTREASTQTSSSGPTSPFVDE